MQTWSGVFQMRGPSSPNQSVNAGMALEAEPVAEEVGIGEDANAENLYLMGTWFLVMCINEINKNKICSQWKCT